MRNPIWTDRHSYMYMQDREMWKIRDLYLSGYIESLILAYDQWKERAHVHLVALEAWSKAFHSLWSLLVFVQFVPICDCSNKQRVPPDHADGFVALTRHKTLTVVGAMHSILWLVVTKFRGPYTAFVSSWYSISIGWYHWDFSQLI